MTEFQTLDRRLEQRILGPSAADDVHVFDFDGVLSAPDEEAIYRFPMSEPEAELIPEVRQALGLDCRGLDLRYQRHLLFQEVQLRRRVSITPGPALSLAAHLSIRGRRVFVLTARSGVAAVRRAHAFLDQHRIKPVETFHVGRVSKAAQVMLLRSEMPGTTIWYYEDNATHLSDARSAHESISTGSADELTLVLIKNRKRDLSPNTIERAIFSAYDYALGQVHGAHDDGRDRGRATG